MKEQIFVIVMHLKLKIAINFFFIKQFFFNSNPVNTSTSLKFSDSFWKCYFKCILLQNSLQSLVSSDSFNFFLVGEQSRSFSKTLISASVGTWLLKLNIVSEQKYPHNLLSVFVTLFFWCIKVSNLFLCSWGLIEVSSKVFRNSFKIFKISLSSSSNPQDIVTLLEEFCTTDVLLRRLGGNGGSSERELTPSINTFQIYTFISYYLTVSFT